MEGIFDDWNNKPSGANMGGMDGTLGDKGIGVLRGMDTTSFAISQVESRLERIKIRYRWITFKMTRTRCLPFKR